MRPLFLILTMNVTVIGVAGGTGSGKSTLVKRLQEAFANDDVATLCHDFYYKAHPELTYEERTKLNYDHPAAFDTDMLVEHIRTLKSNVPIEHPVYSFVEHNRTAESVLVKPSKVIIVDGILIFENKELRELMDIKVFVDTDADIRLARRILRDVSERGRSMQSVIDQYTNTVKPMHEEFVEPSKKYADVIIHRDEFYQAEVLVKNADGIDLRQGCHDILIENITGFTEDDSVALTALNGRIEKAFGVEGLSSDLCRVEIRNIRTASFCTNVRLLNQGDIALHDILVDGVYDVGAESPYMDRGRYAVRVGDTNMYGTRHATEDETYNITIRK